MGWGLHRAEVSGSLKAEINPFLHKDQQFQNSVNFAASQAENSPFRQPQTSVSVNPSLKLSHGSF